MALSIFVTTLRYFGSTPIATRISTIVIITMSISILIKKKLYKHLLKILELCPIDLLILSLHLMMSLVRLQLVLVGRTAEVRLRYYQVGWERFRKL